MNLFKSANRNLPLLPDLIIEEIISYAAWNDLLVWSQVSAFCFRIASRRIWSHMRLHDRALVASKNRRHGTEFFILNEEKLLKNVATPLNGLADHGKQAFPINIRAACVTQFTLSMGASIGGYRIEHMMRNLLPAIPFMSNLIVLDWDACRPPSNDVIHALVDNCSELTTFRCIPRRSEFSREVQSAGGKYSVFEGLENLHDLKELSVRVRGAYAAQRLCAVIKNSPQLSRLSIVGPHEFNEVLDGLFEKKLPPLNYFSIENVIIPSGRQGQDKLLRALDQSTDTMKELAIEPCPGLSDPNFLKRTYFPNIVSFKFKYDMKHYPVGREPTLLESVAEFVDYHVKLSKIKLERVCDDKVLPLPKSLLQALNKPERLVSALALNAVDVSPDDLEELVKRHGHHMTNLAFFSSYVPLGPPERSTFRAMINRWKGKKHVLEVALKESGVGSNETVNQLIEILATHATNLVSLQIYHSISNLKPLGPDGPLLPMYRFTDIYKERSRQRMQYIAQKLPRLQFAGDWRVLTWYVERDNEGNAKKLLDVDRVASRLEMRENEESLLEKTFSWYGKFVGRRPWEGKLTTIRRYQ